VRFMFVFMLFSCAERRVLAPDEYVNWFYQPHNGFIAEKEMGEFIFKACLIPKELMALRELEHEKWTETDYKTSLEKFTGSYYVQLRIEDKKSQANVLTKDIQSLDDFHERVAYFNFLAEADFSLVAGSDTLP